VSPNLVLCGSASGKSLFEYKPFFEWTDGVSFFEELDGASFFKGMDAAVAASLRIIASPARERLSGAVTAACDVGPIAG
jgi:hypothetical protein